MAWSRELHRRAFAALTWLMDGMHFGGSCTAKVGSANLRKEDAGRLYLYPATALSALVQVWDEFEKLGFGPPVNGKMKRTTP